MSISGIEILDPGISRISQEVALYGDWNLKYWLIPCAIKRAADPCCLIRDLAPTESPLLASADEILH